MEIDKQVRNDVGNVRTSEESFNEAHNLSPIEEESESTVCKESSVNFSEPDESSHKGTRSSYKDYRRTLRKMEVGNPMHCRLDFSEYKKSDSAGDSSSGDERTEQNYCLRRVEGSYCTFRPFGEFVRETEASGDNDEAEVDLRDKSLKTTVKRLQRRLFQAEREIVALKRYQGLQKCWSHERREILRRELLTWRDNHEKKINSQIVRWQLADKRRIYNEMENTRKMYDSIQQHLEDLERRSARFYVDFRRQIDVWEKRLKDDVVSLHENNLTELREQLKAWVEMQSAIRSLNGRRERHKLCNDGVERQEEPYEESYESAKSDATTSYESDAKFLHRVEHVIKFEVQQRHDSLMKRLDQKIAELWSAFEDFKHNFHLDRDYRRRSRLSDYAAVDNNRTESIATEDSSDFVHRESAKSDLSTDSEEKIFTI